MSAWWLFLIIPGYLVAGGFAGAYFNSLGLKGSDTADAVSIGLLWPVTVIVAAVWFFAFLGVRLEALRPSRRRQERDRKIAEGEQAVYGKVLSR